VTAVREEIGLLFGINKLPDKSEEANQVKLTNRIILSPFAAKRLALLLDQVVLSYESEYGNLDIERSGASVPVPNSLSSEPILSRPEITDGKARILFELVMGLNVHIGIERSFKFFNNTFLTDRFLLGFKKDDVTGDYRERIMELCEKLNMPSVLMNQFRDNLTDSNIVLLGFEGDGRNRLYKAYLEFGKRFQEFSMNMQESFLLHQGFKWNADDNEKYTRADYICFRLFSAEQILARIRGIYQSGPGNETLEIAEELLKLSYRKVGCEEMLYLEVSEEENPRKSFDLNFYRANLRMMDIYPLLERICRYYSISENQFNIIYKPVNTRIFGHLSGGLDRNGKDFMTIYFGVKGSSIIPQASR
jgi:hypothetical protein